VKKGHDMIHRCSLCGHDDRIFISCEAGERVFPKDITKNVCSICGGKNGSHKLECTQPSCANT
jgi:hypothetical protein